MRESFDPMQELRKADTAAGPFDSEMRPGLPPPAWLYELPARGRARLVHGESVDVFDNGFFEGCFDGAFGGDPGLATNVFGSGIVIRDGRHLFVPPSSSLEATFLCRRADRLTLSNSLAFLLEHERLTLPWCFDYTRRFSSIVLGTRRCEKTLIRADGAEISRFCGDNVAIGPGLSIAAEPKPLGPAMPDFAAHVSYLRAVLRAILANAGDPRRRTRYAPLATCSSGYDSATCAAIASEQGCREAVTLRLSRRGRPDSGLAVGRILGLSVEEFEHPNVVNAPFSDLADFLASGLGGEDCFFLSFRERLTGRLLLSGHQGGLFWDVSAKPTTDSADMDGSGAGLQEFRLRWNFLHVPLPCAALSRQPEAIRIAHSEEMRPYRLGHPRYDRPVPRRILEERGVPRDLFGMEKNAGSVLFFFYRSRLSRGLRRELAARIRGMSLPISRRAQFAARAAAWHVVRILWDSLKLAGRICPPFRRRCMDGIKLYWYVFEHMHPRNDLYFLAALDEVRRRYREAARSDH